MSLGREHQITVNLDSRTILTKILGWPGELLSKLHGEAFSANGWRDALRALGSDLESLGKSTEGEFLSIGEKLQGFYQRAGEISKISSSVANLMSGEELGTVIEGFGNVIDRMKLLEGASRRNTETLRDVFENLARLNHHVDGFHKTIRRLRVLCVSTRIESALLGDRDTGFETLADEVGKLSAEIENRCFQLLASSESLSHMIGHTLSKVLDLETTQRTQAGIVLDKTMASLEPLLEKHGLSAAAAGQISTRYEAVSQRIGEIVTSMQFHDITRQRIEHAQQALAGIGAHEPSASKGGQPEDGGGAKAEDESETGKGRGFLFGWNRRRMRPKASGEHLRLVGDVSDLQIAQLHYAGEELVSAVNNILDNLSTLADLVAEMAQETSKMAGAADETGQSFLTGVEAGFSLVTSALKTYGEADRELSFAMGSAGGMLGEMLAHTGSIEAIGEKIKLIALNATVKACRIGDEGATLGVLAGAIHQLSVETRQRTENASEALRSITSASESLCAGVNADETDKGGELAFVGEALRTQLQTLQDVNQRIVSLLTRTNLDGCSLSEDIRKTIDEVHVHRRVELVISNVAAGLEKIAAFSRSKGPADGLTDRAERMGALEATYTMQGEREVHHSLFELKTNPAEKPHGDAVNPLMAAGMENEKTGSEPDKADEEDLGDNVELF
jgi:methyl-accepting chemotaxis protein